MAITDTAAPNQLREIRESKNMKQSALCAKSGVSLGTINRIERWNLRIRRSTAAKLCKVFGRRVDDVFPYLSEH